MSHSARTIDDLLALEHGCGTCGVTTGQWCEIREGYIYAGQPAQFLHAGRGWATRHARWVGYTAGQVDGIEGIQWAVDHAADKTVLTPGGCAWLENLLHEHHERADRWAQSAHQRALTDIPSSWQR